MNDKYMYWEIFNVKISKNMPICGQFSFHVQKGSFENNIFINNSNKTQQEETHIV